MSGMSGWAGGAICALVLFAAQADAKERIERDGFAFEYGEPAPWVRVAQVPDAWPADAPGAQGAGWRNWLLDAQVDRRGPVPRRYFDHVVEATTPELLAAVAKFSISFSPEYETLVLHRVEVRRDGRWSPRFDASRITLARREREFESDMATGVVSALVVVDDVRPGDLVRYTYSRDGENPILGGLAHDEFVLAWVDPILERRVRVVHPPGTKVATRTTGEVAQPVVRRGADGVEVEHVGRALAAIAPETEVPPWHRIHPTLQVAPERDWAAVARWGEALYADDAPLPADLEARVAEWRRIEDEPARVSAALQAVQDEVRYFSVLLGDSTHRPAMPAETWTRRFGDCKDKALLLSTVLRRLDVPAVPAMVSAGTRRALGDALPAASQFDHVIVRAAVGGRPLWLDPTLSMQRGPLVQRLAPDYGFALPVEPATKALERVELPPEAVSRTQVTERFEPIDGGAAMRFTVTTRHAGDAAVRNRVDLGARGVEAIARDFAEYYRRRHDGLEVEQPLAVEDDPATGEIAMREVYRIARPWAASTPSQRGFDLYADTLAGQVPLSGPVARRHPLWRTHPLDLSHVTQFVVPDGWRLRAAPDDVAIEEPAFRFSRTSTRDGSVLEVRQAYRSHADHVPTNALVRHVDARRKAADALGDRLVLDLPREAARSERDRRLRGLLQDIMAEKDGDTDGKD